MTGKTGKQFFFETDLQWTGAAKGVLTSKDATDPIPVSMPLEFGGVEKEWTPEHLFLSSLSSCYMITLLSFVHRMDLQLSNFECKVIGEVELVNGSYRFTTINLFPTITVNNAVEKENVLKAIEKTNTHCIMSNSINAIIYYHTQVLIRDAAKVQG